MSDLEKRRAALSDRKRELLARLAGRKPAAPPAEPALPSPVGPGAGATPVIPESKEQIATFYDAVTRQLDASPFAAHSIFLNYGYVPNEEPSFAPVKLPPEQLNRGSIRLVLELVGELPLRPDMAMLDVGCGRGGTVWVLRELLKVGSVAAVDLSPAAARSCGGRCAWPDTHFLASDAEALPFRAGQFDAVTNEESSHCYPNLAGFYREVRRVLRPGGHFLYTDLLETERLGQLEDQLSDLGFRMEHRRDITSNVLLSCAETAAGKARAFSADNNSELMDSFLGAADSPSYEAMRLGVRKYMLYRFASGGP